LFRLVQGKKERKGDERLMRSTELHAIQHIRERRKTMRGKLKKKRVLHRRHHKRGEMEKGGRPCPGKPKSVPP